MKHVKSAFALVWFAAGVGLGCSPIDDTSSGAGAVEMDAAHGDAGTLDPDAPPAIAEIIPDDRRIDWAPGVPGGIPSYPVAINVKVAPYNAVGDGIADDTAAIASALVDCPEGSAVYVPAGTYKISNTLELKKSIVLRGAGMGQTRIVMDTSTGKAVVRISSPGLGQSTAAIIGGFTKGSTELTFASANAISGIAPGQMIAVFQDNDLDLLDTRNTNWGGVANLSGQMVSQVQMVRVTAKTDATLTLARPLYWTLDPSLSPGVRRFGTVSRAGIEDLSVDTVRYLSADSVVIYGAMDSWVKNVKVTRSAKSSVWIALSLNCEVRGSWVADPWNTAGGSGYGYHVFGPNSDHLIEDNIAEHMRHSFVLEGAVSGSVWGYNYSKDPHSTVSLNWVYNDLITHALHPFMNLYEGNVIHKWSEDYVHGSASHNTGFRNHIRIVGDSTYPYTNGYWAISAEMKNYYMNVVGNVLGWPGLKIIKPNASLEGPYDCIYKLGYNGEGDTTVDDPQSLATILRHGNFDHVTASTVWDPAIAEHALPASLYRTTKPEFFGILPWPAIGPDLTPMAGTIPAEVRYGAM